ncbi:MAG: ATP-grasp domain-containing protein [Myxococcota bacterium]
MRPDVLFLQPVYPTEMQHFTRGLSEAGARVWGVGDSNRRSLPDSVTPHLAGYLQVPSLMGDERDIIRRIEHWLGGRRPDFVEAAWEPVTLLAAKLRERWGLPGMSVDTVLGFRDKKVMHERIHEAGLRTARSVRVNSEPAAWEAAKELGYPLVIKPTSGAGGQDTFICADAEELAVALGRTRHVSEVVIEEFVTGEEYTFEALTVNGKPLFHSVCRYLPNVLDARQNEWISPIIFCIRNLEDPHLADGMRLGHRALDALGMGSGISHMEWFRQSDGTAVFGEMACRPPGAAMMDLMNYARDVDLFRAWGRAVIGRSPELPTERPYNAAIVFKRAQGQGRIRAIHGLDAFVARYRPHIARVDLLPLGANRRNWKATFMGDGNIVVRHRDQAACLELAQEAATQIHMFAG